MIEFFIEQTSKTIHVAKIDENLFRVIFNGISIDLNRLDFQKLITLVAVKLRTHQPRNGTHLIKPIPVSINGFKFKVDDNRLQEFLFALKGIMRS